MKIHFLGANRQVTGSRYCIEAGDELIMIDCGMFQEREFFFLAISGNGTNRSSATRLCLKRPTTSSWSRPMAIAITPKVAI
jgi:hypothetical protein